MPTREEIERRVRQNDTSRSARRSAAAQQVGDLAARRAEIADQLAEVERQLGDVLAEATKVMDLDEVARFTDVPAADLTGWLAARKPARGKRKKPTTTAPADTGHATPTGTTSTTGSPPTQPDRAAGRDAAPNTPARVSAAVS